MLYFLRFSLSLSLSFPFFSLSSPLSLSLSKRRNILTTNRNLIAPRVPSFRSLLLSSVRSLNNVLPDATTRRAIVFPSKIKFHLPGRLERRASEEERRRARLGKFNGSSYNCEREPTPFGGCAEEERARRDRRWSTRGGIFSLQPGGSLSSTTRRSAAGRQKHID